MLEVGQDEGGAGDVTDLAGAGSDLLEGAPSAGKQREPALAQVPAGGGPGDGVGAGQRAGGSAVAEPPQAQHGLPKQVSARLPACGG